MPSSVTLSLTIVYESVLERVLCPSMYIYSCYLSLYSDHRCPPPPFHRPLLFLIYTHIQLSLFVDHQHSTVAVDMCRALWTGCDGGRGGGPTRDTLHAGFCDNTFSDTCEIRVCPRSAVCNVMSHPCFSCNCSSLCILYVCNI